LATVKFPVPELAAKDASPAKLAVTAFVNTPALIQPATGQRLVAAVVATPEAFVVADAVTVLPSAVAVKLIVLPDTPTDALVSVAVKVPVPPYVPLPLTAVMVVAATAGDSAKFCPVTVPPLVTEMFRMVALVKPLAEAVMSTFLLFPLNVTVSV
jgi:hypothetical protein